MGWTPNWALERELEAFRKKEKEAEEKRKAAEEKVKKDQKK